MSKYKCLKGFKDIYNSEYKVENYILEIINEVSETYNYKHIDLPEFEFTSLYTDYYKDIEDSLFTIDNKSSVSMSLRYDSVFSIVRSIIENKLYVDNTMPIKLMSNTRTYSYDKRENPDSCVHEEFTFVNANANDYHLDLESIIMGLDILDSLGMEELKVILHKNGLDSKEFNTIKNFLAKLNIDYEVSREKDSYYDKLSYELVYSDTVLAKGGRHDNLFTILEAPNVASSSLALDLDEIKNIIQYTSLVPPMEEELDFLVVSLDKEYDYALEIASRLREYGVKVDISYNDYDPKRITDFIDRINIPYTIFINKEDIKQGIVTVRNSISKEDGKVVFEEFLQGLIEESKHHHDEDDEHDED